MDRNRHIFAEDDGRVASCNHALERCACLCFSYWLAAFFDWLVFVLDRIERRGTDDVGNALTFRFLLKQAHFGFAGLSANDAQSAQGSYLLRRHRDKRKLDGGASQRQVVNRESFIGEERRREVIENDFLRIVGMHIKLSVG